MPPVLQPPSSKSCCRSQHIPSPQAVIQVEAAAATDLQDLPTIGSFQDHCCEMSFQTTADDRANLPKTINKLTVKNPNKKH